MGSVTSLAKPKDESSWSDCTVQIDWSACRHADLPVLEAVGHIRLWDDDEEGAEEPTINGGTIRIAKPYLWAGEDPLLAMDAISGDYEALAACVLGERTYHDEFFDWFTETFGVLPSGDPIFVYDIDIPVEHRSPREPLAAQAVLEAAAAFGGADSPIIGFELEQVTPDLRDHYRSRGLWDWVDALGAKPWRDIVAASRPQG